MSSTLYVESSGQEYDIKLDQWLKDMLPRLPGVIRTVARRELILAAREFFEQSACWRAVLGPKNLVANKKTYYLSPYDAYTNIVQVLSVEGNGAPLRPMLRRPSGVEPTSSTTPYGYWIEAPDQVRVWPMPSESKTNWLTFYVVLTPKQTVKHLPRQAASLWYDALLDGALGRLYSHPAKPYTDSVRAQYHLQRFRAAIGKYAGQAKQQANGAGSWAYPRFGKGVSATPPHVRSLQPNS